LPSGLDRRPADGDDDGDVQAHEIVGVLSIEIGLALRVAIPDLDRLALDPRAFAKPLA